MPIAPIVAPSDAARFQQVTASIAFLIGFVTLVGLAWDTDALMRWLPSSTSMNPVTAILLMIGAIAVLLPAHIRWRAMPAVAFGMITAGGLKLGQAALGRPLGLDQLLAGVLGKGNAVLPDALALNTALAFILLGGALVIGRSAHARFVVVAQLLVLVAVAIAAMALVGFALNAATINQLTFNRMAVNTALGLAALGMAILSLNPAHGVMRLLLHHGPTGALARRALPICLIVPSALGVVRLALERGLNLTTGDGVAIMVAGNIALTLGLLWGSLILLMRSDLRLRAQAIALAVSQDQYRLASRIGKMGHWQYDATDETLHWTNEYRALLGFDPDVAPAFAIVDARIHPDDRAQAQNARMRALANGEDWTTQIRLIAVDGSIQYARSIGICRRGPDGALESVLGVLADITELEKARQGTEAASLAQANFLANMCHEIRTPLNGVLGFIDLVLDSELDASQRRYLVMVHQSAEVLLKLLNDVLDLSKVKAGHLEIAPEATDLRRTLRHAVQLMIPIAEQKGLVLTVEIAPDFPAAVVVDGGRVRQILLNLLGNALKFTDHGQIGVSLRADIDPLSHRAPRLQLTIVDSGVGIPADRKEAIFGAFVQADSSTSRRFGGSGLGLSISSHLADLMGGTIAIESTEGVGTTATLDLPLVAAPIAVIAASQDANASGRHGSVLGLIAPACHAPAASAPAIGGCSILLVEDVAFNRELCGEMLRRLGHRVDFACDGAEALAMAARLADEPSAWDLILMDIQMPVMNGTESARAIRALGGAAATIPIVALSANAFATEKQASREAGMNDHVVKPIGFAELRRTVETWARVAPSPDVRSAIAG